MRIILILIAALLLSNCTSSYVKNKKIITSPNDLQKFANIWCAKNNYPTFKCLHAHCEERSLEQLLAYAELRGVVIDDQCSEMRVWIAGRPSGDGTPRVVLPSMGKPDSVFAKEIGDVLGSKNCWFYFFLFH